MYFDVACASLYRSYLRCILLRGHKLSGELTANGGIVATASKFESSMVMSVITKSNAKSILFDINLSKVGNVPTDGIYPGDLSVLSDNERRWLAAARMFYEDFELFVKHAYRKKEKSVDTQMLVYEGRMPSYHADKRCENLLSDYANFEIPVEIQGRGSEEVARFRKWFRANEQLFHDKAELFITRMEIEFRLKNPPSVTSLEAPNSGVEAIENLSLEKLRASIDSLLEKATQTLSSSDRKSQIIRRLGNRSHERFDDEVTNQVLKEWRSLKQDIKTKLLEYFKVSLNPDLEFNGMLLEQLGFRQCRSCHLKAVAPVTDLPADWPF